MSLTQEEKKYYNENGYVIVKNIIPLDAIDTLMEAFARIVRIDMSMKSETELLKLDPLQEGIIALKKKYPRSSAWIHGALNNSLAFNRFAFNLDLDSYVRELISAREDEVIGTPMGQAFRFDIPGETAIMRDWHQDRSYMSETKSGNMALATWIPMNKVFKENGAVISCIASHKEGKMETVFQPSTGQFRSEQYVVPPEVVNKYTQAVIEADKGDIAFLHWDLLHRSGFNVSNIVRHTVQTRYVNIACPTYRPVRFYRQYDEFDRKG